MKKKVLIIEDDLTIQHIVTYILQSEGFEVIGTPRCSIAEIQHCNADLILLDEWINKREGHMLCKDIKTVEKLKHTPVIIFSTANNIIDIVETCNADGFVSKPFELDVLLAEVKKHLSTPVTSEVKQ